jgi:deoxyribose-phosphate aldolase
MEQAEQMIAAGATRLGVSGSRALLAGSTGSGAGAGY